MKYITFEKNKNFIDGILLCILLFVSLHFCIKCISVAFTHAFSFDGAIIAQVAQNVAEKLKYKTYYWDETFAISATGPTVILPVAAFFRIFGETFTYGLLINSIYMVLLFFAIIYYLKFCLQLDNYFILVFIVAFYCTKELFDYGFGLYGEIPMIFYFIAALICIHKYWQNREKSYIIWAGLFLGCGFLTKFVFLIILPGLLFVVLWDVLLQKKEKIKTLIRHYMLLLSAFILPNFLFEIYKLVIIGIKSYFFNWKWFLFAAGVQAGTIKGETGRIKDSPDLFTKVNAHIDLLSNYAGFHKILVILLLILGIVLFYILLFLALKFLNKKIKPDKNLKHVLNGSMLLLITVMLTYFTWWIFITPTDRAWHRRIMPGIILYEICIVIFLFLVWYFVKKNFNRQKKFFFVIEICVASIFVIFIFYNLVLSENISISFKWTKTKQEITEAGRYFNTFPADSEFFGFKWWQAPNISFASKKIFKDFFMSEEMKTTGKKQNKFLVLDREAINNQRLCIEKILSDFVYELVFINDEVKIYKLTERIREREYIEECN